MWLLARNDKTATSSKMFWNSAYTDDNKPPGAHFLALSVYSGDAEKIFSRWDWMIGVIIFFAMTFLYYATHTFHNLFPLLDILWKPDEDRQNYLARINKVLSDRAFLTSAIAFGLFSLSLGLWFGLPDGNNIEKISFCWGYFLVGFVCGLPACGIYGVIDIIAYLSRAGTFEFEYTSPDGCGGVRFLGDAIIKFSTVTLIVGVLISLATSLIYSLHKFCVTNLTPTK